LKANRLLVVTLSLVLITGFVSPAFAGVPFGGERNTVWVECNVTAGQEGDCSLEIGPSDFLTDISTPTWTCQLLNSVTFNNDGQSDCRVTVPNFIDPLGLKLFHITTDFAQVDAINCFDNFELKVGSRDSKVPNGDGFIEEWRCEPNPDIEDIFFSLTTSEVSNIVIHTVSKDISPVGGIFEGVDTTSLLVAGAQMNADWMIPVIVSGIGIAIVIARKF